MINPKNPQRKFLNLKTGFVLFFLPSSNKAKPFHSKSYNYRQTFYILFIGRRIYLKLISEDERQIVGAQL